MIAVAVHSVLFFLILTPSFETNDDAGMMFIADGTLFGEPSADLVFQHPVIGVVLANLYRVVPTVNWYTLWLYVLHATILAVALYLLLGDRRSPIGARLIGFAGFWSVFSLWMWMQLQFTHVSILLGAIGVILYSSAATRSHVSYWVLAFAGSLVGFAALVRWRGFLAVAVLALPLLPLTLRRITWRRQAVFAGTVLGVLLFGIVFQTMYYAGNSEWHAYSEFNSARGVLHGSTRLSAAAGNPDLLKDIGWSRNDLEMFRSFFFLDEGMYTVGALEAIAANTPPPPRPWTQFLDSFRRLGLARLLLLGGLFGAALSVSRKSGRLFLVGTSVWFIVVVAVLARYSRLPNRISLPILAFLALIYLLRPHTAFPEEPRVLSRAIKVDSEGISVTWGWLVMVLLTSVTVWALWHGLDATAAATTVARSDQEAFEALTADLGSIDPEGVFVNWGGALPIEHVSPTTTGSVAVDLVVLGWNSRSPGDSGRLIDLGITDLYQSIALDEHVMLSFFSSSERATLFRTYYRQHYGFDGRLRPIGQVQGGFFVFDVLVDYTRLRDGLVEQRADQTTITYPLVDTVATGEIRTSEDGKSVIGWAVALDPPGKVELLVVFDEELSEVLALSIPTTTIDDVATELSVAPDTKIGFAAPVPNARTVRVYAITTAGAVEIRRVRQN